MPNGCCVCDRNSAQRHRSRFEPASSRPWPVAQALFRTEAPPIVKAGYLSLPRGRDIVCRYPLMLCVYSEEHRNGQQMRIGIVGCGRVLKAHLNGYKELLDRGIRDFTITDLCSLCAEDVDRFVAPGGPPRIRR